MPKKYTKYTSEWYTEIKKLIPKTEKVDNTEKSVVDKLKAEREKLQTDYESKKVGIKSAEDKVIELENKLANKNKWENFAGTGTSTKWNTTGWNKSAQTWLQGSSDGNARKATINGSNVEITEDEAIYLLSRVVKAFKGISENDFRNWENGNTRGTVAHADALNALTRLHN